MSEVQPPYDGQPIAKPKAVALYPRDVEDVETIRRHFGLDSFSQAIRRAIRIAVVTVSDEPVEAAA